MPLPTQIFYLLIMNFNSRQIGKWSLAIMAFAMFIVLLSFLYAFGDNPLDLSMLTIIYTLFALITLIFYGLFIEISEKKITLRFGIGLIRRSIDIDSIEYVECVRNKWWYGWGIRLTPHGWMSNVSGLDAVEIKYKNMDKKFRIGTDDSKKLKEEIQKRILRLSKKEEG